MSIMNIYLHELRTLRKSTVLWAVCLSAIAGLFFLLYPGLESDAKDFTKLLANYPPQIRAMLGINLNFITSILGFYSFIFTFIILGAAIQGMNLGLASLSREMRMRTADFLLVKPVSRRTIVTAKLLAPLTSLVIADAFYYVVVLIFAEAASTGSYDGKTFFLINLTILFIQLIFFAIGMAISAFYSKMKTILPLSLGIVIGLYMIGALVKSGGNNDAVRYLLPFNYFQTAYIIEHTAYEGPYLIAAVVIVAVAIATGYIVYTRKDIDAAA